MRPLLDLVSATFNLLPSERKPTFPSGLDLTLEKIITSFSLPWYPSTVLTSTSCIDSGIMSLIARTWPAYGVTIPMSGNSSPPSSISPINIFTTHEASTEFSFEAPSGDSNSSPSTGRNARGASQSGQSIPAGAALSDLSTPSSSFPS